VPVHSGAPAFHAFANSPLHDAGRTVKHMRDSTACLPWFDQKVRHRCRLADGDYSWAQRLRGICSSRLLCVPCAVRVVLCGVLYMSRAS
jgi:hypothetical protein